MERPEAAHRQAPSNPLLSSAVTGVCLQDLTHHAVLMPALAPEVITSRQQNASPKATDASEAAKANEGNIVQTAEANVASRPINESSVIESKSASKPDDFDVNEYFARLQGTIYVSAPVNSVVDDKNANLEEAEDNLEEINLLEDRSNSPVAEVQSLTADIAQNFSQLPQRLPQVASAVFSSFSSILNLKSKETTDEHNQGYSDQNVAGITPPAPQYWGNYGQQSAGLGVNRDSFAATPSVPMFTPNVTEVPKIEERPAIVGPPPAGSAANSYRITSKKKTYAHIPGLNTSEIHAQPPTSLYANSPQSIALNQSLVPQPQQSLPVYQSPYQTPPFPPPQQSNVPLFIGSSASETYVQSGISQHNISDQLKSKMNLIPADTKPDKEASAVMSEIPNIELTRNSNLLTESSNASVFDTSTDKLSTESVALFTPSDHLVPPTSLTAKSRNTEMAEIAEASISLFPDSAQTSFKAANFSPFLTPGGNLNYSSQFGTSSSSADSLGSPSVHVTASASSNSTAHIMPSPHMAYPQQVLESNEFKAPTIAPPPVGMLPPSDAVALRSTVNRSILPPSVARKLSNPQPAATRKTTPSELNYFVPTIPSQESQPANENTPQFTSTVDSSYVFNQPFISENAPLQAPMLGEFQVPNPVAASTSFISVQSSVSSTVAQPPMSHQTVQISRHSMMPPLDPPKITACLPNVQTDSGRVPLEPSSKAPVNPQAPPIVSPKVPIAPPKATGVHNFRLGGKRPQYYSGPIEGTVNIENAVKPVLEPVHPTTPVGNVALFTPSLDIVTRNTDSFSMEHGVQNIDFYAPTNVQTQSTETVFDLSRPAVHEDNYAPQPIGSPGLVGARSHQDHQTEENKNVDLLGSIKSKISSVNINKFQSAVTSFFDPTYYETETKNLDKNINVPYPEPPNNAMYGQTPQMYSYEMPKLTSDSNLSFQHGNVYLYSTPYDSNYQQQNQSMFNPSYADINQQYYGSYSQPTEIPSAQSQFHLPENLISGYPAQEYDVNTDNRINPYNIEKVSSEHEKGITDNIIMKTRDLTQLPISEDKNINIVREDQEKMRTLSSFDIEQHRKHVYEEINQKTKDENIKATEENYLNQNTIDFFGNSSAALSNSGNAKTNNSDLKFTEAKNLRDNESNLLDTKKVLEFDNNNAESGDITTQMIANMTSPLQLFNPTEAPLTEDDSGLANYDMNIDNNQLNEISQITEETIETIQTQSYNEFFEKEDESENIINAEADIYFDEAYGKYVWSVKAKDECLKEKPDLLNYIYGFKESEIFEHNKINVPKNASDEIKAELRNVTQEEIPSAHNILPRQMNVPSAPPSENTDPINSESADLDVSMIELDAKKDFAELLEPYIIEPSETDDDKLEKEKSDDSNSLDDEISIAIKKINILDAEGAENSENNYEMASNVVEGNLPAGPNLPYENVNNVWCNIKCNVDNAASTVYENVQNIVSPTVSFASYFDTGNYAADIYTKNAQNRNTGENLNSPLSDQSSSDLRDNIRVGSSSPKTTNISEKQSYDSSDYAKALDDSQSHLVSSQSEETPKFESDSCPKEKARSDEDSTVYTQTEVSNVYQMFFSAQECKGPSVAESNVTLPTQAPESSLGGSNTSFPQIVKQEELSDPIQFFSSVRDETVKQEESEPKFNILASYFTTPDEKVQQPDPKRSFFDLSQGQDHYMHTSQNYHVGYCQIDYANTSKFEMNKNVNISSMPLQKRGDDSLTKLDFSSKANIIKNKNNQIKSTTNLNFNIPTGQSNNYYSEDLCDPQTNDNHKTSISENIPRSNSSRKTTNTQNSNIIEVSNLDSCAKEDFTLDAANGGEVEQTFIDYESHLAGILQNCEKCSVQIFKDRIKVYLAVKNLDTTEEAMDADDQHSTKKTPPAEEKSRGNRRNNVKFNDNEEFNEFRDFNEDEIDGGASDASSAQPLRIHWFYRVLKDEKVYWRPFSTFDSKALEEANGSRHLSDASVVATDGGRYDVYVKKRSRVAVYWTEKPNEVRRCSWFYKGTLDLKYMPYSEDIADILEVEYQRGCETGEWHRRVSLPGGQSVVLHSGTVMVHFLEEPSTESWSTSSATSRPRAVRRGADVSEAEPGAPARVDHLLLLCHGIGSACDLRFRPIEEVVDDFRTSCVQLINSHYKKSVESGAVGRVEVLPVSWHAKLHEGKSGVDSRLAAITLDSIPKLRGFCNDTVMDVLFYTSPLYGQKIMDTVGGELNRICSLFRKRNPEFRGGVSLGGHSLGSVILFDLLCHQATHDKQRQSKPSVRLVAEAGASAHPSLHYPQLPFMPRALYAFGSPIAIFECIRGVDALGEQFRLPTCPKFFNIFHPYDPIAYRIEPLINPELKSVPPLLIPHHKGRKRMHLELKETMARVGADLKARVLDSWMKTWTNMFRTDGPQANADLPAEEEDASEETRSTAQSECTEPDASIQDGAAVSVGALNEGRRVDHVLQEAPLELLNEYLSAVTSHLCYWESSDTMLLMLREVYDELGVAPDSSLPQQSLTVEVERPCITEVTSSKDSPSTSKST